MASVTRWRRATWTRDGVSIPQNPLSLFGGATVRDSDGNNAVLTHAGLSNQSAHKVDGVRPTVSSIAITSSPPTGQGGQYKYNDTISFTITFSEAVTFDGSLLTGKELDIDYLVGSDTKTSFAFTAVSSSTTITISTFADEGDLDTDGISIPANPLSLAGGATIKDASKNNAVLTYAGLGNQSAHKVEAVRPSIAFPSSPAVPQVGVQSTITLTDANAKVAKYAVLEVVGTATDATGCDDPSTSGDNFTTTAVSPVASSKTVQYMPLAVGKNLCVYAEDAAGNSRAALWDTPIQAAPPPAPRLVSNTGQTTSVGGGFVDDVAQAFTTGPHRGGTSTG